MDNISSRYIVKNQIKEIKVFLPKQCPFRFTVPYYDGEEDYCGYLKSLHKIIEKQITFGDHIFTSKEKVDAACFCIDDRWIEGCPLLEDDFKIVKN